MRQVEPLPFDHNVLQDMVNHELDRIAFVDERVGQLGKTIGKLYGELDAERIEETQVPGLGPTIAPAIEAWVGDVDRFGTVSQFSSYFGLVPRSAQTGVGEAQNPTLAATRARSAVNRGRSRAHS